MKNYDHKRIEKKWQAYWATKGIYATKDASKKGKRYILDMFPYPSGEGLHVGHPKGYIATDVTSRMSRMQGHEVLHPMGWDAFGLPAENYAIKNKVHPRNAVEKNVKRFKEQLKMIGLDYDWKREINTTDPEFYKWTQWIFLKLYEKGLAYESYEPINWCPTCKTGLSNEDLEGNACERCGTIVEKKPMRQWILKITAYADRLLEDLALLPEWQEHIKESQRNWIGKSEGAVIDFALTGEKLSEKNHYVILHGREAHGNSVFIPWLKSTLEAHGHSVENPDMPNTMDPVADEQADHVQKTCTFDENTVIIGHSFGGIVAMRLLERGVKVKRVALVGTPFSGNFKDDKKRATVKKELQRGFDFHTIRKNAKRFLVVPDVNDPIVPLSDAESWVTNLQGLLIKGTGTKAHFLAKKEPDVLMAALPTIRVFTTRPDTLFGATYVVLSPEHPWLKLATSDNHDVLNNRREVISYCIAASKKTEIERQENKEKTGVKLEGVEAINPANGEKIPVYVADYVLANYGTGAIMAVPAHDERDFEFAKKFNIPIKQVIAPHIRVRTGSDAWREGVQAEGRDIAMCIVKHWEKDEILCEQWNNHKDIRSFISGGIEDGEDALTAGLREIQEETGFTNAQFKRQVGNVLCVEFYHQVKQINRRARTTCLYFELKDGDQVPVATEEREKSSLSWVPTGEAFNFVTLQEKKEIQHAFENPRALFTEAGVLINSGEFDWMHSAEAKQKITEKFGRVKTTYKLRDWVFSRQRYWGEPIPMIHCPVDGLVPVPEKDLPVKLPDVKHYEPTGTGESPLAAIEKWVNVKCPKCGAKAKRETNTMPQWAGSSWYYLRYMDPKNKEALVDKKKEKFWAPVDLYVGGAEHATRHLIYARFWHKFLLDIGAVSTPEPFTRLISVGLIQAEDGRKMSKRYGNVINPDDIVKTYGADSLRVYEMFMGPFTDAIAWNTNALVGARRFLERVWKLQFGTFVKTGAENNEDIERQLHRTVKKVTEDIANFKFNTAISAMMIFLNMAEKSGITRAQYFTLIKLLAPFAPHITEGIWQSAGKLTSAKHSKTTKKSVHVSAWPTYDESLMHDERVTIVVQVNGKLRAQFDADAGITETDARSRAQELVATWLGKKKIVKVIFIKDKLLNLVVADL